MAWSKRKSKGKRQRAKIKNVPAHGPAPVHFCLLIFLSSGKEAPHWRGRRRSSDGEPENVVQFIVVDPVFLAEIHARGTGGRGGLLGIALIKRDSRLLRRVGRRNRRRLERRVHGTGAGVEV